jgi:hypothetical protein
MNYGVAFVAGAIHKYYDDIQDNKVECSPLFLETLKVLMVTTMTMLFMRSPGVSLFFIVIIAIYWSLGSIDSDVWKACVPIPFLTCIVQYNQYGLIDILDILQRIVFVIIVGLVMYFEDGIVPEETSLQKSFIRIGFLGIAAFLYWFYRNLPGIVFVGPMLSFLVGYLVSNLFFHYKTFLSLLIQRPSSQPTVLAKETTNTEIPSKQLEVLDSPAQDDEHTRVSDSDNVPLKSSEAQ